MRLSEEFSKEDLLKKRVVLVRELLGNTKTISVPMHGKRFLVEYLTIPAATDNGNALPPIFIYPGGNTHLGPCFEHALYLNRKIIIISPLGYGRSSDFPVQLTNEFPLYGAEVALLVLQKLNIGEVEIFVHSNAGPIGAEMMLRAKDFGIRIAGITFANPLGVRYIPIILIILAFPFFGMLSRIFSWGHENPYKFLEGAYELPKKSEGFLQRIFNSWNNLCYELKKSSKPQLTAVLKKLGEGNFLDSIPVTVILSRWDWASFLWKDSVKKIFQENCHVLLRIEEIPGLHNSTLGRDSKFLADVMNK